MAVMVACRMLMRSMVVWSTTLLCVGLGGGRLDSMAGERDMLSHNLRQLNMNRQWKL